MIESKAVCRACGQARGITYTGPVYSEVELNDELCAWCIADGTAAAAFDATFTDIGWGGSDDVPAEVVGEIARRTPGFSGWQQEHWTYHSGDGAAFLGVVDKEGEPTAYLFRCRRCGRQLAYSDSD